MTQVDQLDGIMEILMIQSRTHNVLQPLKLNLSTTESKLKQKPTMSSIEASLNFTKTSSTFWNNRSFFGTESSIWRSTTYSYYNSSNTTDYDNDFQTSNITTKPLDDSWSQCKDWTPAQHTLFQTANFFFAAAFLVPGSFKQSVLIVRALLTVGYVFLTVWGSTDVCAPDIFLWNFLLVVLNLAQTALLTWKFLPPTLTLDLMELYLKVFKPLRVSKKHFKELVKEGSVLSLDRGDIYAVEDVSPADERLSILLKGKLRVTCDDTHLHFINVHQFVDSPEWEANHEQSDDVFQVTITAEEDSVYFCWPRMKLERVLRHKPKLKVILDSIIGKDITQKLYALNEHLSGLTSERNKEKRDELWAKAHKRSMSLDAVNTGTTGLVRSTTFKNAQRNSPILTEFSNMRKPQQQTWIPLVAKQFPATSPFRTQISTSSLRAEVHTPSKLSKKNSNVEVKFIDEVCKQ